MPKIPDWRDGNLSLSHAKRTHKREHSGSKLLSFITKTTQIPNIVNTREFVNLTE